MNTIDILERCLVSGAFLWMISVFTVCIGKYLDSDAVNKITRSAFFIITGLLIFIIAIIVALTLEI